MLGGRPSLGTKPFSLRCCTFIFFLSSPPSPPLCLLPALLVLVYCSVCSPLVVPAPWLYLVRTHAPLGLCPVFRPVGRRGRPPQTPFWGDSPFILPRRPPLHQFPDGRAGQPVRLCAGHLHGSSLRRAMGSCVPLLAPCSPHLPRPASSTCRSCVSACSAVFFLCSRSPLLPRALPVRLPSLSEPRCHSCVPPACSTPAPPCRPYPSPWGLPHPSAPLVPVSHPTLVALCPVWGGGVYLRTGLWPCPRTGMAVGFLRTMSHRMCRKHTERKSVRRLSNSLRCICTVEPSRIDQLRTRAPIRTRRSHQGFTLRCTSQVSHGAGGQQGLAWSTPQSRARVSPMVSMQHHLVMQRALPPFNNLADSPNTPAASPQGRR